MPKDLQNSLQPASTGCACLLKTMSCEKEIATHSLWVCSEENSCTQLVAANYVMFQRPVRGMDIPRQGVFFQHSNAVCKSLI